MIGSSDFLVVEPEKSTQLLIVLHAAHLVSVLVVLMLVKNHWFVQLVVLLLIVFSWIYYYRLHIAKVLSQSVLAAYHHQGKGWSIKIFPKQNSVQDDEVAVVLSASSYASLQWVVLNFYPLASHKRYTLLVPKDSVSVEAHRQLRVCLKIMG